MLATKKFVAKYSHLIRVKISFNEELHSNPYNKNQTIIKKLDSTTTYGRLCWILLDNIKNNIDSDMSKEILDLIVSRTKSSLNFFIHNHIEEINTDTLTELPEWDFNELGIITESNDHFFKQLVHQLAFQEEVYQMNLTSINY